MKVSSKKFIKMINRKTNSCSLQDFIDGETILIDKDPDWTSFDVVKKIRNTIRVKKVGHAGTLDPFATGLLIVCTGKSTKQIESYQGLDKLYSGTMVLGKRTNTMDTEGEIVEEKDFSGITEEMIYESAKEFIGRIEQIPPMFSAKKHKGKALYKYARKGVEIERKPVSVVINEFEIEKIELPEIKFRVKCSKGTYIRVLADDFGKKLGCGAYLKELRREAIGNYSVEDALKVDEFVRLIMTNFENEKTL